MDFVSKVQTSEVLVRETNLSIARIQRFREGSNRFQWISKKPTRISKEPNSITARKRFTVVN